MSCPSKNAQSACGQSGSSGVPSKRFLALPALSCDLPTCESFNVAPIISSYGKASIGFPQACRAKLGIFEWDGNTFPGFMELYRQHVHYDEVGHENWSRTWTECDFHDFLLLSTGSDAQFNFHRAMQQTLSTWLFSCGKVPPGQIVPRTWSRSPKGSTVSRRWMGCGRL